MVNEPHGAYAQWKQWEQSEFGLCSRQQARYFAAETLIRPGVALRILEMGFGNGSFIGWARGCGAQLLGVETNPILVSRARDFLGGNFAFASLDDQALNVEAGQLTHIVAFDVIEHIPVADLPGVLLRCRELLRPDGQLILRFPNGDSPFGRMTQHGDPTHVTTLGRGKLEFIANNAGLRVQEIRAPALPLFGDGLRSTARRSLQRIGRAVLERSIGLLYFGGRRIPLDPNYTATLIPAR